MSFDPFFDVYDLHTKLLNWVYSLYSPTFTSYAHCSQLGYSGFADPRIVLEGKSLTPDFVSYNINIKIFQIIDVKSFENIESLSKLEREKIFKEKIRDFNKYKSIEEEYLKNYFKNRDENVEIGNKIEYIWLITDEIYKKYGAYIKKIMYEEGFILWIININQKSIIKEIGKHLDKNLENILNLGINIYPICPDSIVFHRHSDKKLVLFHFFLKLVTHLFQHQKEFFSFDEIDNIMIKNSPLIYQHFPLKERMDKWINFLNLLKNRYKYITESGKKPNTYELNQKKVAKTFYINPLIKYEILNRFQLDIGLKK